MELEVTDEILLECLMRSGYLLESRLVRSLAEEDFFVEPNKVIIDSKTGKSREIDIVTEYFDSEVNKGGVSVKTGFVIEAINNKYPFVLMTQRPFHPDSPIGESHKYITTCIPGESGFFDVVIQSKKNPIRNNVFTQYSAITRKKNGKELMAHHSDDVYNSFVKMKEYCCDEISQWDEFESPSKYYRIHSWQPILVLQNELKVLNG
jgi:hypothetical protein